MRVFSDLEYGNESEAQKLDLYLPTLNKGPYPLVIFMHGGGWQFGDKNDGQERFWIDLVNHGYAVSSINYRLSDEVHHPDGLFDCKMAVEYLVKHADEYNIDTNRIGLVGNSAGAYYALMMALTAQHPKFQIKGGVNPSFKCVAVWYPPTDFNYGQELIKGNIINRIKFGVSVAFAESYFGEKFKKLGKQFLREASPTYYLSKLTPPILIQQGDKDYIVPLEQAYMFQQQAKDRGIGDRVEIQVFEDAGHVDPKFETWENRKTVRAFLDKHLKSDKN